jgi:hypothetical protein
MQPVHSFDPQHRYQLLLQLRGELSVYQTVTCGLRHEQVQELFEETITGDADLEELKVRRKGLCKTDIRHRFLGCAHTLANDAFARLADRTYNAGVLQNVSQPGAAIKELCAQIYLVDHEIGRMEKQKALAQHQGHTTQVTEIEEAMEKHLSRYRVLVDQLEQLRREIVRQLDEAIASYATSF